MTIKKILGIILIVLGVLTSASGLGLLFYMVDYYYKHNTLFVGLMFYGPATLFLGTIIIIIGIVLLILNMIKNREKSTQ